MPEALNVANAFENEMSQLEETKKFHISLYAKVLTCFVIVFLKFHF